MISLELSTAIERTIKATLAPIAVASVDVNDYTDQQGADAISVIVRLPATAGQVPGAKLLDAMSAVSDAVLQLGDERFPYVHTQRVEASEQVPSES